MSAKLVKLILAISILSTVAVGDKSPYTIDMIDSKQFGAYLTNETFFTLYRSLSDPQNNQMSTCYDNCARIWPPFYVENLTINPELKSRDFDVIARDDGKNQLTYKGWPLYLYSGDSKPFETNGQAKNGVWFVVNPMNLTR
jgi:predicted lipoprotein with Yx(FWY)xxD motif